MELEEDNYLINGFQRSSMPLKEDVFYKILKLINLDNNSHLNRYEDIIDIETLGSSISGI